MVPEQSSSAIRFTVEPRDVPAQKAARRLHLTLEGFEAKKQELLDRGFPAPDSTTGMYDLVKIDKWMDERNDPAAQLKIRLNRIANDNAAASSNRRTG